MVRILKLYLYPKPIFKTIKSTKPVVAMQDLLKDSVDPDESDYFIYPFWLYNRSFTNWTRFVPSVREGCALLPHYKGNERKHVFFCMNDNARPYNLKSHFFRTSVERSNRDRRVHSVPYTQRPMSYRLFQPTGEIKYHLSFCGNIHAHKRKKWCKHIRDRLGDRFLLKANERYFGHIAEHAKERLADKYIKLIHDSRFVLCPRGGGPSSRRLYETMAAGRVPVVISPRWIPPFQHAIDWSKLIVHGKNSGQVMDMMEDISDDQAAKMGQDCQSVWYNQIRDKMWWKSIKPILLEDMP